MTISKRKNYVISYDIVENRKRTKAAEALKDHGRRVQKSVFECRLDAETLAALLKKLQAIFDKSTDSILVYVLCEGCVGQRQTFGTEVPRDDNDFLVL